MHLINQMFFANQRIPGKAADHYAIIGSGLQFGFPGIWGSVVLELTPNGPGVRALRKEEQWTLKPIQDSTGARFRAKELFGSKDRWTYDLLANNCEHWARYIAYGTRKSEQVVGGALFALLIFLAWCDS